MGRVLSKSKLVAYRQCPKRLWLEVHRPALREDSARTQAVFKAGHQVGDIARRQYDPHEKGTLLDPQVEGFDQVFAKTQELLEQGRPIFEAGFRTGGALALADVLLPVGKGGSRGWRMIEVKSSTTVKDYHRDDAAIQVFIARATGLPLSGQRLPASTAIGPTPGTGTISACWSRPTSPRKPLGGQAKSRAGSRMRRPSSPARRNPRSRWGGIAGSRSSAASALTAWDRYPLRSIR